jgi:hypothetical protein
MKTLSIVIILFFCYGCKPALKTAYGIKKPRLENEVSIKKYLAKKHVDTTNVYTFKDIQAFLVTSQKGMLSFPEAIFFNKQGNLVRYKKEAETCNAAVDDFLLDLGSFSDLPEDKSITMDEFQGLLKGAGELEKADVNVFITWTIYSGRLNKTKAFEWVNLINKAKANGINDKVYLLNCDYQKSWNLPPQVIEKLGIKD